MSSRILVVLIGLVGLVSASAMATSYVMMKDSDLADQADLIVVGRIVSSATGFAPRGITRYQLEIDEVLTGSVASPVVSVDVLGGKTNDGRDLIVYGVPRFHAGQRTLLFLVGRPGGTYGVLHLLLGGFREGEGSRKGLAVRDLSEGNEIVRAPQQAIIRKARDFVGFSNWLRDRGRGVDREPDYFVDVKEDPSLQKFTYSGVAVVRNFDFAGGGSVEWRTHLDGQPGLTGDGRTEFQSAIDAWNQAPNTEINYTLGPTTTASGGFTSDGVNGVLYDDPNAEVDGTYSCLAGGVLGVGGASASGVAYFKNQLLGTIMEVDMVMNDGVECEFAGAGGSKKAEEVYAHELGHTLGFGHSCGDFIACTADLFTEALMRSFAHFDGRGARLNRDDRAAALRLYCLLNPFANLIFAQFVNGVIGGEPNTTRIVLANNGEILDTGEIRFFDATGAPQPVPLGAEGARPQGSASVVDYRIDPGGVLELETEGTGGLVAGSIEVVSDLGTESNIEGTEIFSILGFLVSVPSSPLSNFQQAFVRFKTGEKAGVAIYNPDRSNAITVDAKLRDDDGTERASAELALNPGERVAHFVDEAVLFKTFLDANPDFTGSAIFSTEDSAPFALLGLLQRSNGALIAVSSSGNAQP